MIVEKAVQELNPATVQFKILTFLAFRGPSQPSAISDETGIKPGTVRPALRMLLEKGYVLQIENGVYKSILPFTDIISNLYAKK